MRDPSDAAGDRKRGRALGWRPDAWRFSAARVRRSVQVTLCLTVTALGGSSAWTVKFEPRGELAHGGFYRLACPPMARRSWVSGTSAPRRHSSGQAQIGRRASPSPGASS
jgi:hypothetical protein